MNRHAWRLEPRLCGGEVCRFRRGEGFGVGLDDDRDGGVGVAERREVPAGPVPANQNRNFSPRRSYTPDLSPPPAELSSEIWAKQPAPPSQLRSADLLTHPAAPLPLSPLYLTRSSLIPAGRGTDEGPVESWERRAARAVAFIDGRRAADMIC